MFVLNTIAGSFSFLGKRIMAPEWEVSLNPKVEQKERTFAQEHLTTGLAIGGALLGLGAWQTIVGQYAGEAKNTASGVLALVGAVVMGIAGHFTKVNEKKEMEDFVGDLSRASSDTNYKYEDLVLSDGIEGRLDEGIKQISQGGVLFHFYGPTNLGKTHLLESLPQLITKDLKVQLGHDVKVNRIKVENKFLEHSNSLFGGKSPEDKFKAIVKHYAELAKEANKDCKEGDVKEVFYLEIEECSGLFRESLKVAMQEFAENCPGVVIGTTTNAPRNDKSFNDKRGVYNVKFQNYTAEEKTEVLRRAIKRSDSNKSQQFESDYAQAVLDIFKTDNKKRHNQGHILERFLVSVNPYEINKLAESIVGNMDGDKSAEDIVIDALTKIINDQVLSDTIERDEPIDQATIREYLGSHLAAAA